MLPCLLIGSPARAPVASGRGRPGRAITLVACYPFYFVGSAPKRYIVRAVPQETQETATASRLP